MLTHPTLDMLRDLGLHGMAKGFQDLDAQPEARALDHGEWLAILIENEATLRRQKRFEARARAARLRHDAQVEDADFRAERGLDRSLFLKLAGCDWIRQRHGLLITGPAGVGKSWLACALGHKACREDFSVVYHRAPRLFATLALARGDGRYARMLKALARTVILGLQGRLIRETPWPARRSRRSRGSTCSAEPVSGSRSIAAATPSSRLRSGSEQGGYRAKSSRNSEAGSTPVISSRSRARVQAT